LAAGSAYPATIDQQVSWVTGLGMGIIIDLHWNQGGQQSMADRNSITYWSQVAARYKGNPWVIFELYNEPHDVAWSVWLNGDGVNYAGMQEMYNAVRAAGASNMVLCGGLNWAFDLSGVGAGYAVTGTNIGYATHPYDYDGKQTGDWDAAFGYLAATSPVVMTEFGQYCNTDTYVSDLLTYAQNNKIHWTAWAWYVSGCAFPSIISDWAGTPIAGVGELVKQYLSGNAPVSVSTTGSATQTSPTTGSSSSSGSSITPAGNTLNIFTDSLASGWQDYSWAVGKSLSDTTYVQSGSASIKFPIASYGGIYFHSTSTYQIGQYSTIQFYVNGGTSAVSAGSLSVELYGTGASPAVIGKIVFPASVPASQWALISVPLASYGLSADTQFTGIAFASSVSSSTATIWIDNVALVPASSNAATSAPTTAPTQKATSAPTQKATAAPTAAPTQKATAAPTNTPTQKATAAPTQKATAPPTNAPTQKATSAPTAAPTTKPTSTTGSISSTGCDASHVTFTQTVAGSWQSGGKALTQYSVNIGHSCAGKTLVGLTFSASNWNPQSFWNVLANGQGTATLALPSYATATSSSPFNIGYISTGAETTFTATSATFQ